MTLDESLSACLGHVLGEPAPARATRSWLAQRNLGLAPAADPESFTWAGPFLARLGGGRPRWVVMFGVPPAILWDPLAGAATTAAEGGLQEALVLAPLDVALAVGAAPFGTPGRSEGSVVALVLASKAQALGRQVDRAVAMAGRGLEGDRYAAGEGTFSGGTGDGRALTLIEAEVLDEIGLAAVDARRNVVTRGVRLNPLMGHAFAIGEVECVGRRLCEPCAHLERLTAPGVLSALVHRGGLRADITTTGEIEVGDRVRVLGPAG